MKKLSYTICLGIGLNMFFPEFATFELFYNEKTYWHG